jgi:citrate synthase
MKSDMECLLVLDSRTAKSYKIPIQDNFIRATDLGKITVRDADNDNEDASVQTGRPLRILDRGFENTACMVSSITVMYAIYLSPHTTFMLILLQK